MTAGVGSLLSKNPTCGTEILNRSITSEQEGAGKPVWPPTRVARSPELAHDRGFWTYAGL
jgi:hypothetical protein